MSTEAPPVPIHELGPRPKQHNLRGGTKQKPNAESIIIIDAESTPSKTKQGKRPPRPPKKQPQDVNPDGNTDAPREAPAQEQGSKQGTSRKSGKPQSGGQSKGSKQSIGDQQTRNDNPASTSKPQKSSRPRSHHPKNRLDGPKSSAPQSEAEVVSTGGEASSTSARPKKPGQKRGSKFNASLTKGSEPLQKVKTPAQKYRRQLPTGDDLTSKLIRELSTPPWPECFICFAPIYAGQSTWSCSPLIPISPTFDDEHDHAHTCGGHAEETAQCCWTTFHLKCIRPWASKSVKEVEEAWRVREIEREGYWRCPGCQAKRLVVPTSYWYAYSHIL